MDKYINVAEIAFAFKEEEVATQYGGKNDITTGILFALDTLELDMPESIVRIYAAVRPYDRRYLLFGLLPQLRSRHEKGGER